jgi:dolichol-phosphate mannosyltransferase
METWVADPASWDPDEALKLVRRSAVHVVLPAYNEEQNLGTLLRAIARALIEERVRFSIVVVDDGSIDRTGAIASECGKEFPVSLLSHGRNAGLGAAIRDGILHASRVADPNDIIVTMDADETHTPGLIMAMIRQIREGCDVVIASRFQRGSRVIGLRWSRKMLSIAASLLLRVVFPTRGVRDYTCGYRAYRAEVLQGAIEAYGAAFVDQDGFQCMVDILLKLRKMPLIFGEVPLILRYDLKRGDSKMKVGKTLRETLLLVARRRFSR